MVCCLLLSGCAIFGVVAAKMAPLPTIQPRYANLGGQSAAIMIWTDPGIELDYPSLPLDLGSAIQKKLLDVAAADPKRQKHLKDMTFPYPAASVVRFQQEHPEIEGQPVVEVAPRLSGITRLIYIEIDSFQTRAESAIELYRGEVTANLKVIEIENGKGTVAYSESGVTAIFPPKSPAEGVPNSTDLRIYRGVVDEFSTEVVCRFISYTQEE